ncbi:MAG: DUF4384 domain-containing protein [Acidobacteria bacterium]|nr:DUF4384 domain-containing protein [Acidobacteriota bacterium]
MLLGLNVSVWKDSRRRAAWNPPLLLLLTSLGAAALTAQSQKVEQGPYRLEISLERETPSGWETVEPGLILEADDLVRFRVVSNADGYLNVSSKGTSGAYTTLFPSVDAGEENRILAGRMIPVPQTAGAFRLKGPAGHDIVYWVLSPQPLPAPYQPLPAAPASPPPSAELMPRCDETILRARGDCVDSSSGVRSSQDHGSNASAQRSRDLLFVQKKKSSVVSAPEGLQGPVIFEYRIAHK